MSHRLLHANVLAASQLASGCLLPQTSARSDLSVGLACLQNPHQNRTVPPLRYEWVWALKRDFPHLEFSLNGGVQGLAEAVAALHLVNSPDGGASPAVPSAKAAVSSNGAAAAGENGSTAAAGDANCAEESGGDGGVPAAAPVLPELAGAITGVMIGRAAYNIPWDTLADADRAIFGAASNPAKSRRQVRLLRCSLQPTVAPCAEQARMHRGVWKHPTPERG